ncbi:ATP-binding protein [Allopusillimonas ginsengisoli]|uniref:ATP-binding protein n=1 Tax=Allopusillimonas ginsengisoli TaxID=453575 RepID=UPI0039C32C3F
MDKQSKVPDDGIQVQFKECPHHGNYLAFVTGGWHSGCSACALEDAAAESTRRYPLEPSRRDPEMEQKLRNIGVPERFVSSKFGNYWPTGEDQWAVFRLIESYVANFELARKDGRNLLLLGQSGTGKTHLAVAVLSKLAERGLRVRYMDARKRIGMLSCMPEFLVIDNIGDVQSERQIEPVRTILLDRYDAGLPTLLASNLARVSFERVLGDAVRDRLSESGSMLANFVWESFRKHPKYSNNNQ